MAHKLLLAGAISIVLASPAAAQFLRDSEPAEPEQRRLPPATETAEDRRACTGDVYRLCARYIPSRERITRCLEERVPDLSPACRAVFSR